MALGLILMGPSDVMGAEAICFGPQFVWALVLSRFLLEPQGF